MKYLIGKRSDKTGRTQYVTMPGHKHSYSENKQSARRYDTEGEAWKAKCDNEFVVAVRD
jgi:hypothetical protein